MSEIQESVKDVCVSEYCFLYIGQYPWLFFAIVEVVEFTCRLHVTFSFWNWRLVFYVAWLVNCVFIHSEWNSQSACECVHWLRGGGMKLQEDKNLNSVEGWCGEKVNVQDSKARVTAHGNMVVSISENDMYNVLTFGL